MTASISTPASRLKWVALGCAAALGAVAAGAETPDELKSALLPSPQRLSLRGESRSLGAGPLDLGCSFSAGATAWDPLEVLKPALGDRGLERRSLSPAPAPGTWLVALTEHSDGRPSADQAGLGLGPLWARSGESYRLETYPGPPGVVATVVAGGPQGLLYGLQTLARLAGRSPGSLPSVTIDDWPEIAVREAHIHGFDKGYGAGNLKSLTAFTRDLPAVLPYVSSARYNLFHFSIDAAWVNTADRWIPGGHVDAAVRDAIGRCHRNGVEALIELRLEGQRAASPEPDTYPLDPLSEWAYYEKALQRVLRWGPDAVSLSLNDLQPITYPDVLAAYGIDGRFSGKLMAELLRKTQRVIDEVRPGTRLVLLPRFYAPVFWATYPGTMPDLWSRAPKGLVMYTTGEISNPVLADMRRNYGAQFQFWENYTSNHTKELKVLLDGPTPNVAGLVAGLPPAERRVTMNFGYPIAPQDAVILATGELLWNPASYNPRRALAQAAGQVWGKSGGDLFVRYAGLLDAETIMASRGVEVAELLKNGKPTPAVSAQWREYRRRAEEAQRIARELEAATIDSGLKRIAEILYWNAKRIELDAQAGSLAAAGLSSGRVDGPAIEAILRAHERVIVEHYPVEANDPKSAEVVMRGIRSIRSALAR